jgi:hypothetical protein
MEDLFNLNPDDFTGKAGGTRKVDENLYNPGPDQGQNGIYKAIIRFTPWPTDPKQSKYKKYSAKLTNPLTNEKLFVDCPSTTGAPSILWSLDTELKNLKDSEPTIVEEIKKYFNRYYNYYSCVYIKRDPQFPNLEGKIKVYSFGYGIDNLIQQEINPESEIVVVKKINPYSLTEGKDFVLVVKRKTKAWRDYSASKFMSEVSPLILTHDGKEIPVSTEPKVAKFATEFLKANSPDLSQYFLKEWTDEEYVKIAEYIKAIVPYKQIIDNLVSGLKDEKMKKLFTNSKPINRTAAPAGENLEFTPAAQTKSEKLSIELEVDEKPEIDEAPDVDTKPEIDPLNEAGNSDTPPMTGTKGKTGGKSALDDLFKDL